MHKRALRLIGIIAVTGACLQGCAALVVGAGAGVASAAHDRRTLGTQIDDKTLAGRISQVVNDSVSHNELANIDVHVFNGIALLVGQAPSEAMRQQAERAAAKVKQVRKVHNQIRVGSKLEASSSANDYWLATKVRSTLIADKRIDGLHISVAVEDSEVFLMGLVTESESTVAVELSRNIDGVARVVKAFEYL